MTQVATIPQVLVEVDSSPLGADALSALSELRLRQRLSAPAQCELTFDTPLQQELPGVGATLRLSVEGRETALFTGEVTAVEHVFGPAREYHVVVRAYDPLHRLRKSRRARALVQTTVEGVAGELAGELDLTLQTEHSGPVWANLVQHRESDLELLVVLAERCGLYPVVRDDELHLLTLEGTGEAIALALEEDLLEARVELNGDRTCRTVTAAGWDPLSAQVHTGTATDPRAGRAVAASVAPGDVGGAEEVPLLDEVAHDEDHVRQLAQAELDARSASEVVLWAVAEGDPRLRPGARVDVAGLRDELDGTYVLTDVEHVVDTVQGYVSRISTAAPEPRTRRTGTTTAVADVIDVNDPDGRGRVRVSYPAYGDVESDWIGIVTPGAGEGRGMVALPDVGDRVLVLFAHEDPAAGVVLGGLYGTAGPPDPGVHEAATRRFRMRTGGGQTIALDDVRSAITLEDATGNRLDMAPDRVTLHTAVDLLIEAPERAIRVRAKTVDFERAT